MTPIALPEDTRPSYGQRRVAEDRPARPLPVPFPPAGEPDWDSIDGDL